MAVKALTYTCRGVYAISDRLTENCSLPCTGSRKSVKMHLHHDITSTTVQISTEIQLLTHHHLGLYTDLNRWIIVPVISAKSQSLEFIEPCAYAADSADAQLDVQL